MNRKIEQLLKDATEVAISRMTRKYSYQFGAAARRKDGATVYSYNEYTVIPTPPGHAEHRLVQKCDYGSIIAVVRLNNAHEWMLARPCATCRTILKNMGVKKAFYSIADNEYGVIDFGN